VPAWIRSGDHGIAVRAASSWRETSSGWLRLRAALNASCESRRYAWSNQQNLQRSSRFYFPCHSLNIIEFMESLRVRYRLPEVRRSVGRARTVERSGLERCS
jgi:hypothetical protein